MAFEFAFPDVGEGIHEGEIVNWLVHEGDEVDEDQDIVEVMTDKATVQISAPVAGTIADLRFAEGDTVEVGQVFVVIEPDEAVDVDTDTGTEPEPEPGGEPEPETSSGPEPPTRPDGADGSPQRTPEGILAPPSVRIEARKRGVDITRVEGTGPAGRISMQDLETHEPTDAGGPPEAVRPTTGGAAGLGQVLAYDLGSPSVDREQAREIQAVRAHSSSPRAHASRAMRLQPHFTHAVQIPADELVRDVERATEGDLGEDQLTTAFVVKAIATALRDHERCNAWVDEESRDLVVADGIDVAVATPTPEGLELRTVSGADERGVRAIARTLAQGGEGNVEPTFTVTAYEGQGGLVATPILIHPQVAGASIGRVRDVAVLEDGDIRPGKQMSLAFTFDHRYIDGYAGALLAADVQELLTSPGSMLLD